MLVSQTGRLLKSILGDWIVDAEENVPTAASTYEFPGVASRQQGFCPPLPSARLLCGTAFQQSRTANSPGRHHFVVTSVAFNRLSPQVRVPNFLA